MLKRIKKALEARILPASVYVKKQYRLKTGRYLNLKYPKTFSEKLQWLKLNNKNDILSIIADKEEVKKYVSDKIDEKYVIPTHSIYTVAKEIKLNNLPDKFALKATHGSGWNQIHLSHDAITEESLQEYFRKWLNKSYYLYSKEWAYKKIVPRVICEELFLKKGDKLPEDYKIFCFSGKPTYIQVDHNRFGNHSRSFYTREWEKMPFTIGKKMATKSIDPPDNLNEMIKIAEILSKDFIFLRVDLFNIDGAIKVGELTCYPGNGMETFSDKAWDIKLGDLIRLG